MAFIVYNNFTGGINDTVPPDNMQDKEVRHAENVTISNRGGIETRPGNFKLNENSYNAQVNQIIEWVLKDGSIRYLAVIGTDLCEISKTDGTKTIKKSLNRDFIAHVTYRNNFYFIDGDGFYEWDGETDTIDDVDPHDDETNDLEPIKRCKYLIFHTTSFRFFAAGDPHDSQALYFSEVGDIGYFKTGTNKMYPVSGSGAINGIKQILRSILVSYKSGWHVWNGIDVATATWKGIPLPVGITSNDSVTLTPNSLSFLSDDGPYSIHPSIISDDIQIVYDKDIYRNLALGTGENLVRSMVHKETAKACFYGNKFYLAYGDDKDNPYNNKIFVYDWDLRGHVIYSGIQVNDFMVTENKLFIATKNYILEHNKDALTDIEVDTGDEIPIDWEVVFKPYSLGNDSQGYNDKLVNRLFLSAKQYEIENDTSPFDIYIYSDYSDIGMTTDVNESLVWGRTWGKLWGYTELVNQFAMVKVKGLRHQVVMRGSAFKNPVFIYSIGFDFAEVLPGGNKIDRGSLINET